MRINITHPRSSAAFRCGLLASLLSLAAFVMGCGDTSDESSRRDQPNAGDTEPSGTWGIYTTDGETRQPDPPPTWSDWISTPCPSDGGAWPYQPFQAGFCEAAFLVQNVPDLETDVSGVFHSPADAGRSEEAPPAYAPIPADEPFSLVIMASLNHRDAFVEYTCSAEVDEATRTVRIHVEAMLEGECLAIEPLNHNFVLACDIPALAAGTWTFERTSGPGTMTLELPQEVASECDD